MTMHTALHPRDEVNRLYVSRKESGRGLTSIDASLKRLENKHRRFLRKNDNSNPKQYR